eukprot:1833056-Alexandrium_andersonii.AAC.1
MSGNQLPTGACPGSAGCLLDPWAPGVGPRALPGSRQAALRGMHRGSFASPSQLWCVPLAPPRKRAGCA